MRRGPVALAALALLAGPLAGLAGAQERPRDERGAVELRIRDVPEEVASYLPHPWEQQQPMPPLDDGAVVATSDDDTQLRFVTGGELGTFRPAPEGGTPFFGSGQPIFGLAAPPVLPSRVLRPLGSGDTGDRFLGERPELDQTTVIPKLGETFDQRRESFAFIGEIPPIPDESSGSPPFPAPETVEADPTPGVPDNVPVDEPGTPPVTPPTTPAPTFLPGPGGPAPTTPPTTPPTTAPTPGTTVPPRPTVPPTRPTTPTTAPTRPTTPTTQAPTTTTAPPTTTTAPTTTTTIPPIVVPPTDPPVAAFVLGNQRNSGSFCYSNDTGGTHNPGCQKLFDFGETDGSVAPGRAYAVDLTLWNVAGRSNVDATELRGYAVDECVASASGAADLCEAIQLTIQRYSSADRSIPVACLYGGGTAASCSFSPTRTLGDYGRRHTSMSDGVRVVPGSFDVGDKAYLRISVLLPDRGIDAQGQGRENVFDGHSASLGFRWGMQSD